MSKKPETETETAFVTKAMVRQNMSLSEKKLFVAKERVLEHHFRTFKQAGEALLVIRDKRLYREHHATFEEYCRERWDMSKTQANRLIAAAQTVTALEKESPETSSVTSRFTEGSVRPLTTLKPETQKKVVAKLMETQPKEITAKLVTDTARAIAPKEVKKGGKAAKAASAARASDLVRRSEFLEELAEWEKTHKANGTFEQLTPAAVLQQVRKIINSI